VDDVDEEDVTMTREEIVRRREESNRVDLPAALAFYRAALIAALDVPGVWGVIGTRIQEVEARFKEKGGKYYGSDAG